MKHHSAKASTLFEEIQSVCESLCGCGAVPARNHSPADSGRATVLARVSAMPAPHSTPRLLLPVCLLLGVALLCPLGSASYAAEGPQQLYPRLYPGVSSDEYEAVRNSLRELEADALRRVVLRDLQAQEQAMEAAAAARSSSREEPLAAGAAPAAESLPIPLPLVRAYGTGPDLSKEEPPVKKMKTYSMSLCLFKICNMGRKRTNRS